MSYCTKCGSKNWDTAQFCTSCGTKIAVPPPPPLENPVPPNASANRPAEDDFITFNCPECNQSIEAPRELAGNQIDCPTCHHPINIPTLQRPETSGSIVGGPVKDELVSHSENTSGDLVPEQSGKPPAELPPGGFPLFLNGITHSHRNPLPSFLSVGSKPVCFWLLVSSLPL